MYLGPRGRTLGTKRGRKSQPSRMKPMCRLFCSYATQTCFCSAPYTNQTNITHTHRGASPIYKYTLPSSPIAPQSPTAKKTSSCGNPSHQRLALGDFRRPFVFAALLAITILLFASTNSRPFYLLSTLKSTRLSLSTHQLRPLNVQAFGMAR